MAKRRSQLLEILYSSGPAAAVLKSAAKHRDRGLASELRYPFLAIVGQTEMKMALLLGLINRAVGGVLLVGARGTAKTTAVRGLVDLMPVVERSTCEYGCEPEDVILYGMDGVCKDCALKLGMGDPITTAEPMRLVELPLNARLEDVVGGINERVAMEQNRMMVERGILSQADQNLLYIDEVNLLDPLIIDAILDAAAQSQYTVRRGPMAATYRSRLTLVGSMNPEEGILRPQIQDRFGLRVLVRGVENLDERMEIYRRAAFYKNKPYKFVIDWIAETESAQWEVVEARKRLSKVKFAQGVEREGLRWIQELKIDSHRAEMTLFEAGRALAAADGRLEVTLDDLRIIAPMALRQRQTETAQRFFEAQLKEDQTIQSIITGAPKTAAKKPRAKKRRPSHTPTPTPTHNGVSSVSEDGQETSPKTPEVHDETQSRS
ncbi:MAG: magnesium chelatase [Anaerolineales bacterium]|nr:magnesium chelatase [Anaerolineales bacterium]